MSLNRQKLMEQIVENRSSSPSSSTFGIFALSPVTNKEYSINKDNLTKEQRQKIDAVKAKMNLGYDDDYIDFLDEVL